MSSLPAQRERNIGRTATERDQATPLQAAALVVIALLVVFLVVYKIDRYPQITFDEGGHLHVPKTLVQYGEYARKSAEGFRYYGPTVATGPTVMLPIALAFVLFGIGLAQARMVVSVYTMALFLAFYKLVRRLYDRNTAIVATLLLLTAPGVLLSKFDDGGRRVFGENPALLFLFLGMICWWKALSRARTWQLMIAGLWWGLAFVTKNNFAVLIPAFVMLGFVGRYYHRAVRLREVILPVAVATSVLLVWYLLQLAYLGAADFGANLAAIRSASGNSFAVFSPRLMVESIRTLTGLEVFYGWLIPGVLYGIMAGMERSPAGFRRASLALPMVVWLGWYAIASIGWLRYAYPALAISAVFVGRLFVELTGDFGWLKTLRGRALPHLSPPALGQIAIAGMLVFAIVRPLQLEVRETLATSDRPQLALASYLDAHVHPSQRIETFEYAMGFLTDHEYCYPPEWVLNLAIAHTVVRSGPPPYAEYDPLAYDPDYMIVGPYVKGGGSALCRRLYCHTLGTGSVIR